MPKRLARPLLGLSLALIVGDPAAHDDPDGSHLDAGRVWADGGYSHDRARRAMENGEIMTFAELLKRIRPHAPGRILHTELEYKHGLWIYEIKLLDLQGRLYELEVAAHNGEILKRWEGR